jgi:multiple sugar transport system ATP-binding protein
MRIEIARLHNELGGTMIYVTHDQVEAMTHADQIVVLDQGRIEQLGTPLDLYHRPANLFVAGFIGSPKMNMITVPVQARSEAGATVVLPEGGTLTVPAEPDKAEPGTQLTWAFNQSILGRRRSRRSTLGADCGRRAARGRDTGASAPR